MFGKQGIIRLLITFYQMNAGGVHLKDSKFNKRYKAKELELLPDLSKGDEIGRALSLSGI